MSITIVGIDKVNKTLFDLANMLSSEQMYDVLWDAGTVLRRHCRQMCQQVVYSTPESKNYKRTGYLKEAIYVQIKGKYDRDEMQARGYALAEATYPGKGSNPQTYKMVRFTPHTAKKSVRVTAAARYADYVEYGTGHMPARPFMRAGAAAGHRDVMSTIENGIKHITDNLNKGRARHTYRDKTTGKFAKRPV